MRDRKLSHQLDAILRTKVPGRMAGLPLIYVLHLLYFSAS